VSLANLCDERGIFRVLAVDHRDSLRLFLEPTAPESVPNEVLTSIKSDLVRAVSPFATGVMLEPEYSIPQLIVDGALADGVGFLAALESQGYLGDPGAGPTTILDGWSVEQAAASGASAAKLLLPYHPDRPLAAAQRAVAAEVLAACRSVGLPLVLEPLFYGVNDAAERARVVLTTVEHFADTGADLLKLPFPVDPAVVVDPDARVAACAEVSARCRQPWALLSGGGGFGSFAEQVAAAIEGGGAGFMVGRALWGEAARCPTDRRAAVIADTVMPRWHALTATIASRVRPPTDSIRER
jgi:tagatose-1,6-bisphosphate aldolase